MPVDPAPLAVVLGAVRIADAVACALLLLFALWGMRRGALRQVLSLGVLFGALAVATWLASRAEGTVAKVTSLDGEAREAAAWGGVLFAALVVGGVLLSFVASRLPASAHGRTDRLLGALFGGVKGALVLVVLAYVLAAGTPADEPSLSRTDAAREAPGDVSPWVARLRGSWSASAMATGAGWIERVVRLPAWVAKRRQAVDEALRAEASPPRRPRER